MEIFAFDLSDKWIDVDEKVGFKVDYLEPDQSYKLQVLLKKGIDFKIEYDEDGLPIVANMTEEQKARFDAAWDYYIKVYLKYVIKDWKGIKDAKGNEIKCVLVNNELEESLWKVLCSQPMLVLYLFVETSTKKLRFIDTDKKKLSFSQDSEMKVD
jgi:hypothetical protein